MQDNTAGQAALRGIFWMLLATLMAALTGGAVRQLAGAYSPFELVFFRTVCGVIVLSPWLIRMAGRESLRPRRFHLFMLRSAFSYGGLLCLFFALGAMPIADVYALLFTTPLFTILMAVLLLKERAGIDTWIACLVGFAGALVILRPGIVEVGLAALAATATAGLYASANICIKALSRTESPVRITMYNNLVMLPLALVPTLFVWVTPTWQDAPWIVGLALSNTLGGLFHARAVSATDARVVQPFTFLRLIWSVGVGYVMFVEFPGIWIWVGATIIFSSSYYILYIEAGRKAAERGAAAGGTR